MDYDPFAVYRNRYDLGDESDSLMAISGRSALAGEIERTKRERSSSLAHSQLPFGNGSDRMLIGSLFWFLFKTFER